MSKQFGLAVIAACLFVSTRPSPARAEMQILESNVPEFQLGSRIADADDLRLPADGYVKVLILPAYETKVFKGPSGTGRSIKDTPFGGTRGPPARPQN